MGQSRRSRMDEVLRGSSLIARIMRETEDMDVLAVADPSKATREPGRARGRSPWRSAAAVRSRSCAARQAAVPRQRLCAFIAFFILEPPALLILNGGRRSVARSAPRPMRRYGRRRRWRRPSRPAGACPRARSRSSSRGPAPPCKYDMERVSAVETQVRGEVATAPGDRHPAPSSDTPAASLAERRLGPPAGRGLRASPDLAPRPDRRRSLPPPQAVRPQRAAGQGRAADHLPLLRPVQDALRHHARGRRPCCA